MIWDEVLNSLRKRTKGFNETTPIDMQDGVIEAIRRTIQRTREEETQCAITVLRARNNIELSAKPGSVLRKRRVGIWTLRISDRELMLRLVEVGNKACVEYADVRIR